MTRTDMEEKLRRNREEILRIASRHGAHSVRLFGSQRRGEADEMSDIDLLVTLEDGVTLLQHAAIICQGFHRARRIPKSMNGDVVYLFIGFCSLGVGAKYMNTWADTTG